MMRILVTGSRTWTDCDAMRLAIRTAALYESDVTVIHGGARGADQMSGTVARSLGLTVESYDLRDFPSPRQRNQHMVDLGADICLAFAAKWASGTGMCARMARAAGIPVIDYGVPTAVAA